jgi:hypothetical protein
MAAVRETVTVVRTPKVDRLKPSPAAAPAEHDLERCVILPRQAYELDRGWVQVDGYDIFAKAGSDVEAKDQLRVRGEIHEVDAVAVYPVKRGLGVKVSTTRISARAS